MLGDFFFCCILGTVGRQPPPANPFSKPLTLEAQEPTQNPEMSKKTLHLNFFEKVAQVFEKVRVNASQEPNRHCSD